MSEIMFYVLAIPTVFFAVLAVVSPNIFQCAVYLAITLMHISGIYFLLEAPFLGVIQVLVYIGGIITLFVFAIKLTSHIGDKAIRQMNRQVFISGFFSIALLIVLLLLISTNPWAPLTSVPQIISVKTLGISFLTTYLLPFEYISVLLLSITVGAIVIGKANK